MALIGLGPVSRDRCVLGRLPPPSATSGNSGTAATIVNPLPVRRSSPSGRSGRSPPIPAAGARGAAAAEGKARQPEEEDDDGHEPQQVNGEAQRTQNDARAIRRPVSSPSRPPPSLPAPTYRRERRRGHIVVVRRHFMPGSSKRETARTTVRSRPSAWYTHGRPAKGPTPAGGQRRHAPPAEPTLGGDPRSETMLAETMLAGTMLAETMLAETMLAETMVAETMVAETMLAEWRRWWIRPSGSRRL